MLDSLGSGYFLYQAAMQVCTTKYIPNYVEAYHSGLLEKQINQLNTILKSCTLCPHKCRVNRLDGEKGICHSGGKISISSACPHFGEEPPLVGRMGSGTIFFANCNLRCVYCQNYEISHYNNASEVDSERLAELLLHLQGIGCTNINFVTPTHYTAQIISALPLAIIMGLNIPLVWNCGGYESLEVIKLLDGIIDIYMPDIKYGDTENARLFSHAPDYFENVKLVIKEMHRQVGDLKMDENNHAISGLLIRHLVLPDEAAGSQNVLNFIDREISPDTYINLMDQYRPAFKAKEHSRLNRKITANEYNKVVEYARVVGLYRGF